MKIFGLWKVVLKDIDLKHIPKVRKEIQLYYQKQDY